MLTNEEIELIRYRCRPNPNPHQDFLVTALEKEKIVKLCNAALAAREEAGLWREAYEAHEGAVSNMDWGSPQELKRVDDSKEQLRKRGLLK